MLVFNEQKSCLCALVNAVYTDIHIYGNRATNDHCYGIFFNAKYLTVRKFSSVFSVMAVTNETMELGI